MNRGKRPFRKRIVILCEGKTEEMAIEHFIRPQWEKDGLASVGLQTRDLRAKLEDIFQRVPVHLGQPGVLAVFTLVDLYGMDRVRHKTDHSLEKNVEEVRAWLKDDFDADDFHPHVSVHELEAWLLADGQCIDTDIKPDRKAEEKDFDNPPKARMHAMLKRLRNGDGYKEVIDGERMFKRARFDVVYENCPYFRAFYDDLKAVAQRALSPS